MKEIRRATTWVKGNGHDPRLANQGQRGTPGARDVTSDRAIPPSPVTYTHNGKVVKGKLKTPVRNEKGYGQAGLKARVGALPASPVQTLKSWTDNKRWREADERRWKRELEED